jgi:subfamily B ATP-binding cassette protein MsbA
LKLWRLDPRLSADLAKQRRSIIKGLLCVLVTSILTGSTAWIVKGAIGSIEHLVAFSREASKDLAERDSLVQALAGYCGIVVVIFITKYWFTRGQSFYLSEAANRLSSDLRVRMFEKLMRLPVSYFSEKRTGAIQSVLTNDVSVYQSAVAIIRDSLDGPVKVVVALVTIFVIQWPLGLLAAVLIPIMAYVLNKNAQKMRRAQTQVQSDLATVGAVTSEALLGARVVKAFGAEASVSQEYSRLVGRSLDSQMYAANQVAKLRPLVELIGAVALAAFFFASGLLAADGRLVVADVAAMALAMDAVNQGFRGLAGVSNTLASVQAASSRIYEEVLDAPEAHENVGGIQLAGLQSRLEFHDVSFAYPDGTQALKNVSFLIEPGTSLALVGPSGAGKSTIADLVLRFYDPTEGKITLDGTDIRELDLQWYRRQIGVVPQHTFLFSGSIADNLRLCAPDATDDELRWALKTAHAEEFTAEMSTRPTEELGESGMRLSGGQRQRIAIARALLRRPPMLLLDEATSALDATSEKLITEALNEMMQGRTTLFIAHRLTTAARASRILVLRRGEVAESGTHAELMASGGAYAGLFRAFSGGILD